MKLENPLYFKYILYAFSPFIPFQASVPEATLMKELSFKKQKMKSLF